VLFIFVVMLLNAGEEDRTHGSKIAYIAGIPGAAAIFCLLSYVFLSNRKQLGTTQLGGYLSSSVSNISEISHTLFTSLLLPFEVTSILILVAILGAVVLARKEL
jgi:NADH-quinone oxidoreductase subunit J